MESQVHRICNEKALTRPSTATAFSLRLRLHYKAARVGSVRQKL